VGIIEDINGLVLTTNRDESLSAMLRTVVEKQQKPRSFPTTYYTVTQLINPIDAYFSKFHPVITPSKLGRKLARGTQLHNFVSYWFINLPDFITDEGTVDGVWEGVDRVRGRIDYFIGDSILEFKTKDKNPNNIEDIFLHYPQDLEQLAFYSIIHPSKPEINYIIFMENVSPYKLKAFKVKIENRDIIRNILRERIALLDEAIENKDPPSLGRCRYYEFNCKFSDNKICSCDSLKPINLDSLKKSLTINFDSDFTLKLEEARKKSQISDAFCVTTFNIISPRKYYMKVVLGLESKYEGDPIKDEYQACLWTTINLLKSKCDIFLNHTEKENIKKSARDPRVKVGFRWINLKKSGSSEDKIIPYLLKVNLTKNILSTRKPSSYNLAELGIICGVYSKSNGLIFTVYPNLNNLISVHDITYKSGKELYRLVKKTVDDIQLAEKNEDLSLLPECPGFMNYDGKCPLTETCHPK